MKVYRRSPFYPRMGQTLAHALARMPGRPSTAVKTIKGVTYELDLSDAIGASLYYSGTFEAKTERLIESRVGPGMVAIDIGANFGYHTFRLAQAVGPSGRVLAFEPMAEAWSRLCSNVERNEFAQLSCVRVGLSDRDEGVTNVAFTSHYDIDGTGHAEPEQVRVTTLDVLVGEAKCPRVDFIKLDVDGYEGKVLRGSTATLTAWHPDVLFEVSPGAMAVHGDSATELLGFLVELGYRISDEDRRPVADLAALMDATADYSVNLLATVRD